MIDKIVRLFQQTTDVRVVQQLPPSPQVELVRGRVYQVNIGARTLRAFLDGAAESTPDIVIPLLADIPRADPPDEIVVARRRADGLLLLWAILGRDASLVSGAEAASTNIYNTPDTDQIFSGQWSMMGRGTLARFGNVSATLLLSGNGTYTAGAPRGWLRLNIAQPSATAEAPLISLELLHGGTVVAADFTLVVTALSTTQTAYELHARVTGAQQFLRWEVQSFHSHHATHEWTGCSPYAAILPAGTPTVAVAV